MIKHISAVTLTVDDMIRSIEFYRKLGLSCCMAANVRPSAA
jgi:hypothetical protein